MGIGANTDAPALLIRFAGSPRAVVTQTAQALKLLREGGLNCETHDDDTPLWSNLSSACQRLADICWCASVLPTELPAFATEVSNLEEDEASHIQLEWHAGLNDGRVRAFARAPVYSRETVRVLERLRQTAENSGGNLVIEKAPTRSKME